MAHIYDKDQFVHALDTRYKPARKVRVPKQHLAIFDYLKLRDDKKAETPNPVERQKLPDFISSENTERKAEDA